MAAARRAFVELVEARGPRQQREALHDIAPHVIKGHAAGLFENMSYEFLVQFSLSDMDVGSWNAQYHQHSDT